MRISDPSRGKGKRGGYRVIPKWSSKKVKKLRTETYHMSQPQFAAPLNVKPPTVRAWEQGQKTPSGAASRLLEVFLKDQGIIKKLMAS